MNRELVERATHPVALEKITKKLKEINPELGEQWQEHAINTAGGHIADRQIARQSLLRWDKAFYEDNREVVFPSRDEQQIRTRLGDEQVEVSFDRPPASLFAPASSIDRITLPMRWLDGSVPQEAVTPTAVEGGFEFGIGSRKFRYDRLGLRRV